MEKKVSDIELKNLRFFEFGASKVDGSFSMTSRTLTNFEKKIHEEQWSKFADKLWETSLELITLLCGFDEAFIYSGRWRISYSGNSMVRRFNSPQWKARPFKSFDAIVHLRDSFFNDRSIDEDFIDLFLTFSSDPYSFEYAPIDNNEDILDFLQSLSPQITNFLTEISRMVIGDHSVHVKTLYPIWDEECVIESGSDGYWIKGIVWTRP